MPSGWKPNELAGFVVLNTVRVVNISPQAWLEISPGGPSRCWNRQADRKPMGPLLTLNVLDNCGQLWPTRIEPRLHCVGITIRPVRGVWTVRLSHIPTHFFSSFNWSQHRQDQLNDENLSNFIKCFFRKSTQPKEIFAAVEKRQCLNLTSA